VRAIYVADTEGAVALAAAGTAKTVFGVKADAGHAIDLLGLGFSLDGVAASEKPVLIEFAACTFATNAPGTASTAVTVDQEAGPRIAETFAAGKNWTTEPTVVTPYRPLDYDPNKLFYERDHPLGESPDFAVAEGFVLRMTIPSGGAAVNARCWAKWARV
jgi:hypothetical protein